MDNRNYKTLKQRLIEEKVDISHFEKINAAAIRATKAKQVSLDKVMVKNSTYAIKILKKRLILEGILENKCQICGQLPFWNGKEMTLILDHINGINNDNRKENLRLVCSNCNIQLPTFCSKNKSLQPKKLFYCKECGKPIRKTSTHCNNCSNQIKGYKHRGSNKPTKEELEKLIQQYPYTTIGKMFNVTNASIMKWMKKYGIEKENRRGYWAKVYANTLVVNSKVE